MVTWNSESTSALGNGVYYRDWERTWEQEEYMGKWRVYGYRVGTWGYREYIGTG